MKRPTVLPLRPLDLSSKPLNHRALAWSSDAELAVAADDSVYVFLPEFPTINPKCLPLDAIEDEPSQDHAPQRSGSGADGGMSVLPAGLSSSDRREQAGDDDELLSSDDEDVDMERAGDEEEGEGVAAHDGGRFEDMTDTRQQFADECRHFPVSRPSLTPEINAHVWNAAGKQMPTMHVDVHGEVGGKSEASKMEDRSTTAEHPNENSDAKAILTNENNAHPGAGIGVIGSAGSSLNHVVAIEYSSAGPGRNQRPVLAVLTGCGSLVVYGEGSPLPFNSTVRPLKRASNRAEPGNPSVRNLESWLALWAVGENFVIPGQEEYGYGEYIRAFAWCREIGPGKALLAYVNDLKELIIVSVSTTFKKMGDGLEEAVWHVRELLRVEICGPHGQPDVFDPDFLPSGSSFGVRWSPWLKEGPTWSSLLSYMDTNYIGFRKITLDVVAWTSGETPVVTCDSQDWDGRCLHLGPDAFLEFENVVWDFEDKKTCRGFIATPFIAEPFEVDIARSNPHHDKTGHSTDHCRTTYPAAESTSITNPITGLVVHPVDLQTVSPPIIPSYTAVRLSATAINANWWESNLPQRRNHKEKPQWATEIQKRITAEIPLDQADTQGDGGSESGDDGVEREMELDKTNNEEQSEDEEEEIHDHSFHEDIRMGIDTYAINPKVHPWRMLLWGIAISPGGGSTAVLTSSQNTQKPERGTWNHYHNQVLFEFSNQRGKPHHASTGEEATAGYEKDAHDGAAEDNPADVEGLSTEARLWEWLYGGGPGVPALTYYASQPPTTTTGPHNARIAAQQTKDAMQAARRDEIRALFTSLVARQSCKICADGCTKLLRDPGEERQQLDCACEQGHRFAVCGASGLAIMEPGVSRCCGVCQARCLDAEVLAGMLEGAGQGEQAVVVKKEVTGDVCMRCGGKYLD